MLALQLAHVAWLATLGVIVWSLCRRIAALAGALPLSPRYLPVVGSVAFAASSNDVHELDDFIITHHAERGMRYTILQPVLMPPSAASASDASFA